MPRKTLPTDSPSPSVGELPAACSSRLIDRGLLRHEASRAGAAERYGRGETSHTIAVWWARRPHTAMRALVFASLCQESGARAEKLLTGLGLSASPSAALMDEARQFLAGQYDGPPRVLDMFGGGGTIPFEALNLGAETYAIDANQLSVFIQKCNLVYSQSLPGGDLRALLEESGERVLNQLRTETDPLYPLRDSDSGPAGRRAVFGYLWTYSTHCDACGYRYFLIKRPWLSRKKDLRIAFVAEDGAAGQKISMRPARGKGGRSKLSRRTGGADSSGRRRRQGVFAGPRGSRSEPGIDRGDRK